MLIVTVGGWSKLAGLLPVNIIWCVVYLMIAYYVLRWARGLLPIAAALGALMFVFTVIAETALAGVTWSDRSGPDYAPGTHAIRGRWAEPRHAEHADGRDRDHSGSADRRCDARLRAALEHRVRGSRRRGAGAHQNVTITPRSP